MLLETSWERGFYIMQCEESSRVSLCYSALSIIIFITQFVSVSHSAMEDGPRSFADVKLK